MQVVGTSSEVPSPRGRATPPLSARGASMNSARGVPSVVFRGYGAPLYSARGHRSTPGTPRPTAEQVHVFIRMRPPRFATGESGCSPRPHTSPAALLPSAPPADHLATIRYAVERPPVPTPRGSAAISGPDTGGVTPRHLGSNVNSVVLRLTGPAANDAAPSSNASSSLDETRTYEFGDVFEPGQDIQLLQSLIPAVTEQLRSGYNAAVLCYGQTGSGKTFTMQQILTALVDALLPSSLGCDPSGTTSQDATPGSAPTSQASIYSGTGDVVVEMSYIQIYGNRVYDLLAATSSSSAGRHGNCRDPYGEPLPKPKGVLVSEPFVVVQNAQELHARVQDAQRRRVVSNHALNPNSSRSHTLLSLRLNKCVDGTTVQSVRVTLADLAGSERVKKSGVAGENLDEAIAINKSLSVLHAVIKASCDATGDGNGAGNGSSASSNTPIITPFRESVLTVYLAPVLTNSFMFIVATISLESSNYHETKSTLEFATTAKKCVIVRTRAMQVAERFRRGKGAQEAIELQLQQEIETLRQRVDLLQEELDLERQKRELIAQQQSEDMTPYFPVVGNVVHRSSLSSPQYPGQRPGQQRERHGLSPVAQALALPLDAAASAPPVLSQRDAFVRERILQLEAQFSTLQGLLRDREAERMMIISRKQVVDDIRNELEQRAQERDEAREALSKLMQELQSTTAATADDGAHLSPWFRTDAALAAIDKVCESFLWLEEEYQKAVEINEVNQRSLSTLRAENHATHQSLLETRRRVLTLEKERSEAEALIPELTNTAQTYKDKFHQMEYTYYREKQERATNEECMALHQAANVRHAELEKIKSAFEDQRALMETLQSRVAELERILEASEMTRIKLSEENRARAESMSLAWALMTAQQRGRYLSSDPLAVSNAASAAVGMNTSSSAPTNAAAPGSVFQGYDNVQLRATVRDLQKQLQESKSQLEHRNYRIEDLEEEVRVLQDRLDRREDEYTTLLRLDGQHQEQNEEMQSQIADLFTYIDDHNARQLLLETRWKESQSEIERLSEQGRTAQQKIYELEAQLGQALADLRAQEQNKESLTARLREAEDTVTTIARMRAEDQARVTELEKQLQKHQSISCDITRKLDQAVNRRQHIAAELKHHSMQGEVLQKRLVRANGEEAKRRIAQLVRGVDQNRILLVNAGVTAGGASMAALASPPIAQVAEHMQRQNRVANLRFEVSQLFRNNSHHTDLRDMPLSTPRGGPDAALGRPPPATVAHKDPHAAPSKAPPPPQQLSALLKPEAVCVGGASLSTNPQHHRNGVSAGHVNPSYYAAGRRGSYGAIAGAAAAAAAGNRASKGSAAPTLPSDIPPLTQIHLKPSAAGHRSVSPTGALHQAPSSARATAPPTAATSSPATGGAPTASDHQRPVIPRLYFNAKRS